MYASFANAALQNYQQKIEPKSFFKFGSNNKGDLESGKNTT
jgi:hypothetical protein